MPKIIALYCALALVLLAGSVDGARAVGLGQACAGKAGTACDAGLWCELQAGQCGAADAEGLCVHAPQICNILFKPVCACGGKTYGNDCDRRAAKVQKAHNGPCIPGFGTHSHREEPDASKGQ
jgi:hypothetical protein